MGTALTDFYFHGSKCKQLERLLSCDIAKNYLVGYETWNSFYVQISDNLNCGKFSIESLISTLECAFVSLHHLAVRTASGWI